MSVQQAPDSESEYSIYATTPTKLKEENLSYTKQESCCSNTSSTHGSKKRYTSAFYYESNDDDDEDNNDNNNDTVIKIRKKKLINIDRRHAGGGGSFLVNDFMCRDILLLVKDLLLPFKSSIKLENNASLEIGGSSSSSGSSILNVQELNKRFIKLHYIIVSFPCITVITKGSRMRCKRNSVKIIKSIKNDSNGAFYTIEIAALIN